MLGHHNNISKEIQTHKYAYAVLVMLLVGFTILFLAVWPNRYFQRIVVIFLAISYFFWGVATHLKTDHISPRVVLEYLGVSSLAAALLLFVTM